MRVRYGGATWRGQGRRESSSPAANPCLLVAGPNKLRQAKAALFFFFLSALPNAGCRGSCEGGH